MKHETKRYGYELVDVGKGAKPARRGSAEQMATLAERGALRPEGTCETSSVYGMLEDMAIAASRRVPRTWVVERLHRPGLWVTAPRELQGKSLEEARNICKTCPSQWRVRRLFRQEVEASY